MMLKKTIVWKPMQSEYSVIYPLKCFLASGEKSDISEADAVSLRKQPRDKLS